MLFGQSVFQSVVERLKAEQEEAETQPAAPYRAPVLKTGFVVDASATGTPDMARGHGAYLDLLADLPPPPEPQTEEPEPLPPEPEVMPEHLLRLTVEDIAAELNILPTDTIASLTEKRRAFAKANHPDGVPAAFRANAEIRMKTANYLIDETIRSL